MRKTRRFAEVGNLVITSGPLLKLLDLFEDVVHPAFTDKKHQRTHGDSSYIFHGVKLVAIEEEVALVGRLVKDTILSVEQRLVGSKLVEVDESFGSSPSSVFTLFLGCHRILYVREHPGSPDLNAFRATLSLFVRKEHRRHVREIAEADRSLGIYTTYKSVEDRIPVPNVELRPLATPDSLKEYIATFAKLETVSATLLKTNSEDDWDPFFVDLREHDELIGSESTTLQYENKETGLNKEEAERQLVNLAKMGNHHLKLKGVDEEGGRLNGTENDFKVRIEIDGIPKVGLPLAKKMKGVFNRLVEAGSIAGQKMRAKTEEKLEEIKDQFRL